ncbi:hypothetical protein [Starkeya sp. ORNL1]|uniref:hypothetical protein n=1 Tax=Starkeya sp. ORNL1 TaxID=2709380 RepID=UPI001FEEB916|nr:hypothetical protein [Starkeya sp. ORNL1]
MNEMAPARLGASVAEYKGVLRRVLDNRPSGTRQRLALALGKNRSFVSQIANPSYPVPIPAQHVETIFEVCHFSLDERKSFLDAYRHAHARRKLDAGDAPKRRVISITVPDLGDARRNHAVDEMVAEFAARLARLAEDIS